MRYRFQGADWAIEDPSRDEIAEAINRLNLTDDDSFAALLATRETLAPDANGDVCGFVQTCVEEDDPRYTVEAQFAHGYTGDDANVEGVVDVVDVVVRQYATRVADADEVIAIFAAFAEGAAPNVAGWSDVTEQAHIGAVSK